MDGVGDYVRYCLQLLEVHKPSLLTKLRYNLPGTDSVFKINTSLPIIWLSVKVCFFFFFFFRIPREQILRRGQVCWGYALKHPPPQPPEGERAGCGTEGWTAAWSTGRASPVLTCRKSATLDNCLNLMQVVHTSKLWVSQSGGVWR